MNSAVVCVGYPVVIVVCVEYPVELVEMLSLSKTSNMLAWL